MNTLAPRILLASGHAVGPDCPCFIVAEIGNNHQGDLDTAREMIRQAAKAGADAVKFQKRDLCALFTAQGLNMPYTGPNSFGPTYGRHRAALELSLADMAGLRQLARSLGLAFFASAWDLPSLRGLLEVGMDAVKIGSADLVNVPLLRMAARSGLPVFLSTGMSSLEEIDRAVVELAPCAARLVLLHCNSTYPCPDEAVGLPVMAQLARRYGLPVGYSGHEAGTAPSVAAAALGACVVERHFTLDRAQRGTDHMASLDPEGMARLRAQIREVEAAMRVRAKQVTPQERAVAVKLRKSLVFARDLPAGHVLGEADLCVKCPGHGLSPLEWDAVLGRALACAVRHDDLVTPEALVPEALVPDALAPSAPAGLDRRDPLARAMGR